MRNDDSRITLCDTWLSIDECCDFAHCFWVEIILYAVYPVHSVWVSHLLIVSIQSGIGGISLLCVETIIAQPSQVASRNNFCKQFGIQIGFQLIWVSYKCSFSMKLIMLCPVICSLIRTTCRARKSLPPNWWPLTAGCLCCISGL